MASVTVPSAPEDEKNAPPAVSCSNHKLGSRIRQEPDSNEFRVRYREGYGALRNTLAAAAQSGFDALVTETKEITKTGKNPRFQASITLRHRTGREPSDLLEAITDIPGVLSVELTQPDND